MSTSFTDPSVHRRRIAFVASLLLLLTMLGVIWSTTGSIQVGPARPAVASLSVDERTYYEYVAPRLDRLVDEVDVVVGMVNTKSRDIIALQLSGNRIETLTDEITAYADEHGVPERFRPVHEEIISGTDTITGTFAEAKSALRRLNFSKMATLIDAFNNAATELHHAQDQLLALAGSTDAAPHT